MRRGQGKSGNLNSACELLGDEPDVAFVETRDADDLVGDPAFLREAVGLLAAHWRRAFVQSIKEARVSPGDPFDNLQPHFYRATLAGKHAANAVFPCGSGLVWRRACLQDIGGFPTWNLVEDLQSGIEALRLGWHGAFLPLVGAIAQHAPEDLPNVYKAARDVGAGRPAAGVLEAVDGADVAPAPARRRGADVLPAELLDAAVPAHPRAGRGRRARARRRPARRLYLAATAAFALALEATAVALHHPRTPLAVRRTRGVWAGLMFVFMRATWLALSFGPRHKPTYRVTRKTDLFAFHWRNVIPHVVTIVLGVGGIAWAALSGAADRRVGAGDLVVGAAVPAAAVPVHPPRLVRRRLERAARRRARAGRRALGERPRGADAAQAGDDRGRDPRRGAAAAGRGSSGRAAPQRPGG